MNYSRAGTEAAPSSTRAEAERVAWWRRGLLAAARMIRPSGRGIDLARGVQRPRPGQHPFNLRFSSQQGLNRKRPARHPSQLQRVLANPSLDHRPVARKSLLSRRRQRCRKHYQARSGSVCRLCVLCPRKGRRTYCRCAQVRRQRCDQLPWNHFSAVRRRAGDRAVSRDINSVTSGIRR